MDKIIAIKVKNSGGTYDEIPITALAQNVYWSSDLDLNLKQHIIGDIDSVKDNNQNIIPLQTQIDNLKNGKADIDSPSFTGAPTINDNELNPNTNNQIATKGYVNNQTAGQLKTSDLENGTTPSESDDKQYPIAFNDDGYLSVNVPWENTVFSSSINNLWTGICSTASSIRIKDITLDNPSSFPSTLNGNQILAIYFKEKNTANNPVININNSNYPIGFLRTSGKIETNIDPFYNFGSGLKFFVYKINYDGNDNNCWLLSTVDYSIISYLNDNKANLDSPVFTGTPKINTNSGQNLIATQEYVNSRIPQNQLKIDNLKNGSTSTNYDSQITSIVDRQYAVVFDANNRLSVNVPWVSDKSIQNLQKLWTGFCGAGQQNNRQKTIILNNENDNYGGMISNQGLNSYIVEGANILIYFQQGNNAALPTFTIRGTNLEKDVLYQNGSNTYSKLENTVPYYQWGPGLKIFTYVKYTENNEQKDGWVISSFDGLIIKNLNDRLKEIEDNWQNKADINSPNFTGTPTINDNELNSNIDNEIATKGYVKSENSKILGSDSNYAIQLKPAGSNNNIFTVDWNGNTNGINLNCFYTEGIKKSNSETTIIGKYNTVVKNATGLFCDVDKSCRKDLMVGGPNIIQDSGAYSFIIGNGDNDENRFNIFMVDQYGNIIIRRKNGITLGSPPDSTKYFNNIQIQDTNKKLYGMITSSHYSDDMISFGMCTRREVNGININNEFKMQIKSNGESSVFLSQPAAWRNALGLNNALDTIRIVEAKKVNVIISANSSQIVDQITIPSQKKPPQNFSFIGILGWRIDTTDTTSGANSPSCVVTNYWGTSPFSATVRNYASSQAKITVNLKMLFRRTTF